MKLKIRSRSVTTTKGRMKTIAELEAEIRQEIPVHAVETSTSGLADWTEAEIAEHRQKERRDAIRSVIWKRKRAASLEELYSRLSTGN
jgi:hypothetical protein